MAPVPGERKGAALRGLAQPPAAASNSG